MDRPRALNRLTAARPAWLAGARRGRGAAAFRHSRFGPDDAEWVAETRRSRRWGLAGAALGAAAALVAFAPATWLASGLAAASGGRVLLADARGTVWNGDAVLVLGAGAGSRDARALPGRVAWTLRPGAGTGGIDLRLGLSHACCLNGQVFFALQPGWRRLRATVQEAGSGSSGGDGGGNGASGDGGWLGQWPAAWLVGLGTPWNTLQPGGALRLSTQGLAFEWVAGRFALAGSATLELRDFSSRIATLPRLGSYRLSLTGDPARAGTAQVSLSTVDGALQLSGNGSWSSAGLRLRGEARAAEGDEAALNNLLNIIGRRDGARSVLSIG